MKTLISVATGLLMAVPMFAVKNEAVHLDLVDPKKTSEGFFFALPRTVVAADVSVDLKIFKPGNLAKYAIVYFPEAYKDGSDPQEASRSFLLKDVTFSSRGEPDPDWVFWTKMKAGFFVDRSLNVQMTEGGAVTGATATADNTLPDFLMGIFSSATGVAGKIIAAGVSDKVKNECSRIDSEEKFLTCTLMRSNPKRIADYQDAIKNNPKAVTARDEVLKEIENSGGTYRTVPNSGLAQADKTFADYTTLESLRVTAVTGPLPAVGIGDRVTQIDASKDLIKKQFLGASDTANWAGRFEFRPGPATSWDLMVLDPVKGACLNRDLYQGKTALAKEFFAPLNGYGCTAGALYTLKVDATTSKDTLAAKLDGKIPQFDKKKKDQGLPYRVPAEIKFSVTSEGKPTPYFSRVLVAQGGLVLALPASLGGRQSKAGLTYFETTGAVKTLDTTGKTILNKSVADAAGASATGLTDAKIAADKAGETKADPLTQLTRQRQLLEEEAKIKAFCEALNKTDCKLVTQQQ